MQLGAGKGGIGAPAIPYTTQGSLFSILAADLDGKGRDELVLVAGAGNGAWEVDVLLNDGVGEFSLAGQYPVNAQISQLIAGDVDGDGRLDVVVGRLDGYAEILLGNGDGTLQAPVTVTTGCQELTSIALADWNGDGIADLACGDAGAAQVSLLPGKGKLAFGPPLLTPMPRRIYAIATADFDGDGRPDLAATDNDGFGACTLQILRGLGNGGFLPPMALPLGITVDGLRAADLDGDKLPELIAASVEGGNVEVFHNLGAPGFAPGQWLATGRKTESVGVGDFNLDGKPDLVSSSDTGISFVINATK